MRISMLVSKLVIYILNPVHQQTDTTRIQNVHNLFDQGSGRAVPVPLTLQLILLSRHSCSVQTHCSPTAHPNIYTPALSRSVSHLGPFTKDS